MKIAQTLNERGERYGKFADRAVIAQKLQDDMRSFDGWSCLAADQKQALSVIADKIARILNGDPNYSDNWHDIMGYAKLVDDRLCATTTTTTTTTPIAATDEGGFNRWSGYRSAPPVGANTLVVVKLQDGRIEAGKAAGTYDWKHALRNGDIVGWKLFKGTLPVDDFTPHDGKEMPCDPGTFVEVVWSRNGRVKAHADALVWNWDNCDPLCRIVGWKYA